MSNDIIFNKIETIQRCLKRINEEFTNEEEFHSNHTKQDSVILNLERASQATIDIGTHLIKINKYGIPKSSREVFELLHQYDIISPNTLKNMNAMVGFRNIAVHDYQNLSIDIVISIVKHHLKDFELYIEEIIKTTTH